MADTEKTTTTEPEPQRPEEYRVPPYRREDYLTSPENDRGKTAAELFGPDPEGVDDKAMDALMGPSDEIVIRTSEPDGGVRETTGKQLRAAAKDAAKAEVEAASKPPAEQEAAEEPEAAAAGEQEPEDPPPAETAAPPEPEAEAKDAAGEEKTDAEPKEPTKRQRRRDARYRAMEAKAAAAEARVRELEKLREQPAPAPTAVDDLPKAADFDDDEAHARAVQAWVDQKNQAIHAVQQERARQAELAGRTAEDNALNVQAAREFHAISSERFTAAQREKNNAAVSAITSKAIPGHAAGKLPVSSFMFGRRAKLDSMGVLGDDAKSTGEVMADMFAEPKTLAKFEDLTGNGHILAGLASLDDPLPVIRYLTSEEGKTKVDDLDRLSAAHPEAVAARVVTLAHQALSNGAAAPGEPAQVEPEISKAPRPGNSPRAAARTQASSQSDPANRADYGGLDPDLQAFFDKKLSLRSGGTLHPGA